ncbi:glycosyltransferase family 4 protein [Brachybacterium epidermidis]|uniref:glycosyltransferase family 4 protein n=1 Tax=Brachybacterium epidermidis TaxID=2781983 RepID=UPI0032B7E860
MICTNEIAGPTGYHKSVVQLANGLHEAGYPVALLGFLGTGDVSSRMIPRWPLDLDVPAFTLRTLPARGGRLQHRNVHPEMHGALGALQYAFTANELAALRDLNAALSDQDTIIFTAPVQALAFQRALSGDARRPRTVLQIHGDYSHHAELREPLLAARGMIDRVQTVADGLRAQFTPPFDASDVVFIPNFPGEGTTPLERTAHEGVNIALPASFQHRKNQLDAVRALSLIDDESVTLTLWGNISSLHPYYLAVRELVESLGLQDRVRMPGFGTEQDVYGSADIVLMTSLSEGFAYPLLEAMYHSRPTVSYDFDFGPAEAIEDGDSGFLVPIGDVELLAARLQELAQDAGLRERFGRRARERFDATFATPAVEQQYRDFLGPQGNMLDIPGLFSAEGGEPIAAEAITHGLRRPQGRLLHRITVASPIELHDVRIDDGHSVRAPRVRRDATRTVIEFPAGAPCVVSYTTAPGSQDRHYLASTTRGHELEILAHLRRDADYGAGRPGVVETLRLPSGGSGVARPMQSLTYLARRAPGDVLWKSRQIIAAYGARRRAHRELSAATSAQSDAPLEAPGHEHEDIESRERDSAAGATVSAASATAVEPDSSFDMPTTFRDRAAQPRAEAAPDTAAPRTPTESAQTGYLLDAAPDATEALHGQNGSAASGRLSAAVEQVRSVGTFAASSAVSAMARAVTKPSVGAHRVVGRHPWFPVSGGVDSCGVPVGGAGGVEVVNAGGAECPSVVVRGEYDWLVLRDGVSRRRVGAPWSYGELFEGVCAAERDFGLFDITGPGGVHVWELGRSALVIQLAEAAGLWGAASAVAEPVSDVYVGPKRLSSAPSARRVVFDYARRGQSGYRTERFVDDETLFVVQPDAGGYPGVEESDLAYPFAEFLEWKRGWRRRWAHLRVPEADARPFEEALSRSLGVRVDLGDHLRNRLAKFLAEREFFTPVFERVAPEEVLIASSHWWAGIAAAAERSGARGSDVQYALTSRFAPSFWFGGRPHYGASRFYAWSDLWAGRTNACDEHVVVPRVMPELRAALEGPGLDPVWDVCVISQPRVLRRILGFVRELVVERPELRVVVAPHPAQRGIIGGELAAAGVESRVEVAAEDTLSVVRRARVAGGTFSTSLWEAAALGCPTFVIEVPGYGETLEDVSSGLFRLARSPHDLVPFEVPESRHHIFE